MPMEGFHMYMNVNTSMAVYNCPPLLKAVPFLRSKGSWSKILGQGVLVDT
jgi:hypothetical protein